jgi:hypothetical protein
MNHFVWALLLVFAMFAAGGWCLIRLFALWNSADGERYQRMRMQGSFVPLSKEDIDEDERRRSSRR